MRRLRHGVTDVKSLRPIWSAIVKKKETEVCEAASASVWGSQILARIVDAWIIYEPESYEAPASSTSTLWKVKILFKNLKSKPSQF